MHDRTKNLTIRQTILARWIAKTGDWSCMVKPAGEPASNLPAAPDFPARPSPDDPIHVQIPLVRDWDAEAKRWTMNLGCAGGRQEVFAVDRWAAGWTWPFFTSWLGLLRLAFLQLFVVIMSAMLAVTAMVMATIITPPTYCWAFAPAFSYIVLFLLIVFVVLTLPSAATFAICDAKPQSPAAPIKAPSRTRAVVSAIVNTPLLVFLCVILILGVYRFPYAVSEALNRTGRNTPVYAFTEALDVLPAGEVDRIGKETDKPTPDLEKGKR